MIGLGAGTRIYLRCGVTDLRKAFDGLARIVEEDLSRSITDGEFIVFCNYVASRVMWSRVIDLPDSSRLQGDSHD